MSTPSRIWVTWETQRRNRELANAFGATLLEFDLSRLPPVLRYLGSAFLTLQSILRLRPKTIFVQNPSLLLATLIGTLRALFSFVFVIDAHNIAVKNLNHKNPLLRFLHRFATRRADLVMVSNRFLTPLLTSFNSEVVHLPDRLPKLQPQNSPSPEGAIRATLVSSFAPDEPIEEVIRAVLSLELPLTLRITGRKKRAERFLSYESERILFTDFLPEDDYENLLRSSELIIDLTSHESCLVCGAYEGVSVGVPLLLTDSPSTREYFPYPCLATENSEHAIRSALLHFVREQKTIRGELSAFQESFRHRWERDFSAVCARLSQKEEKSGGGGEGQSAIFQKAQRGFLWLAGSTLAWQSLSWIFTLFTARHLHPTDYGLLAIAETMNPYLLLLSTLKLDSWIIQRGELAPSEERSLFSLALLLGGTATLLGVFLAPLVADFYEVPQMALPFQLTSTVFFLRSIQLIPDSRLRRTLQFRSIATVNLLSGISRGAVQLVLASLGCSYWSLVIGNIYGEVLTTLLLLLRGGAPLGVSWSRALVREAIPFGVMATGSTVLWVLFSTSDNIIVGKLFGVEVLGFYAFAFYLTDLPIAKLNAVMGPVLVPLYTALKSEKLRLQSAFLGTTQALLFLSAPVLTGMALIAPKFIPQLFGAQWEPLILPLQALSFVGLLRALPTHCSHLFLALNKPKVLFQSVVRTALLLPISFYLFGSLFGLSGIYGTWFLIYPVVGILPTVIAAHRELHLHLGRFFKNLLPPLVATTAMAAVVIPVSSQTLYSPILAGGAAYTTLLVTVFRREFISALRFRSEGKFEWSSKGG